MNNYINDQIMSAKIGSKESYNKIREIYAPLCDDIFKSACHKYPYIAHCKFEIYHQWYIDFWDIIRNYQFNADRLFSYELAEKLVQTIFKITTIRNGVKNLCSVEEILSFENNKEASKERLIALKVMQILPYRLLSYVVDFLYNDFTIREAWKYFGFYRKCYVAFHFRKSKKYVHRKIKKVKRQTKVEQYREKIYRVIEEPLWKFDKKNKNKEKTNEAI